MRGRIACHHRRKLTKAMKTVLPTDCGNAPRITIVGEFVTSWARRDIGAMNEWLTNDVNWKVAGRDDASEDDWVNPFALDDLPDYLEVTSIITHGRLASCDGFLDAGSRRIHFSHVFRFASTSKAAGIREARSYIVESPV
jgi:hypothetical protein